MRGRLVSLAVTDQEGGQNDTCTLTLANADAVLALPEPGATLEIELGYHGHPLRKMGSYKLDEVREASPPRAITLTARAANYVAPGAGAPTGGGALNTQRARTWEAGMTIAAIVRTVAASAGLEPYVSPTAAALVMPALHQANESDLSFLTRIAAANDSWVKPAFGKLVFAHQQDTKAGADTAAAGPPAIIPANQVTSWEYGAKARPHVTAVIAVWRDKAAALDREIRIGAGPQSGDAVQRIARVFADERTARAAAEAQWLDVRRAGTSFDCVLPAPADLPFVAEGAILPRGFSAQVDRVWKLTSVEWTLADAGLSVALKCETAAPEKDMGGEGWDGAGE